MKATLPRLAVGRALVLGTALVVTLLAGGCAPVQVYQRERLLDRIMSFDAEAKESARKLKAFEAREGSTGGVGGSGGGCACK